MILLLNCSLEISYPSKVEQAVPERILKAGRMDGFRYEMSSSPTWRVPYDKSRPNLESAAGWYGTFHPQATALERGNRS